MKFENIISNPAILGGKPIIKGTRISVEFILELLEFGASVKDIIEAYPHLKDFEVKEAIAFAADQLKNDSVYEINLAA